MKTLKLLLFAAILIGVVACYNESVDDYPEYDIPSDVYVGDNTLIHSIEGFDSLYVKDVNIFIKTSAGDPHPQIKDCPFQNATYKPSSK